MTNKQIRHGQVVRASSIEVWDFNQNGNAPVHQEPFQILPGDSFRTSCYYRGKSDTTFGISSREEMCISFLYYYPRKSVTVWGQEFPWICAYDLDILPACSTSYSQSFLKDEKQMNREFGELLPQCLSDSNVVGEKQEPGVTPFENDSTSSASALALFTTALFAIAIVLL